MNDDPDTDGRESPDAVDDSELDEMLDRLESSLFEDSESPSDDPKQTATDSSTTDTDPKQTVTDSSTAEADSAETQSNDEHSDDGRLWDRFDMDRQPDSQSSRQPTTSNPDSKSTDFSDSNHRQSTTGTDDHQQSNTTTDDHQQSNTTTDDHQPDTTTDDHQQSLSEAVDSVSADPERATSFRGLLDRISHRISSASDLVGEKSTGSTDHTDQPDSQSSSTQSSTSTAATQASSASQVDEGPTSERSSQQQSVTIEQVLKQIDLFGRATASSQVLLLSPTAHATTNDIYQRVLLPSDGSGQNVLLVSAIQSPTDQLSALQNIAGWEHGKAGVIEVGRSVLQPPQSDRSPGPTAELDIYKQISNLQNLAKLGVNISHIVSQWNATNLPTVVGVHTLSSIQQYVGNETMFQFLFTLKGQLNSMGIRGFYHMDPAAHTENEINTLQEAFDIVVTVSPDGSIDIQ